MSFEIDPELIQSAASEQITNQRTGAMSVARSFKERKQ